MNPDMFDTLFRYKPALMLVTIHHSLGEIYPAILAKKIGCTHSHTVKILKKMNQAGLLYFERKGRSHFLDLTEKGQRIAQNIAIIRHELLN